MQRHISYVEAQIVTDIVFVFEVHQPHRLRRKVFWENKVFKRLKKEELFDYYFDNEADREIFRRAAKKCYFPPNQILLEFIEQVKLHRETIKTLLGFEPTVFENTELLFNNAIARMVENLGYKGIFTEGVERILHEKSPNYLYTPKGSKKIRVFLRNYKLTDDIGFRFSARWWSEYPLTADKYARWLPTPEGDCLNIFPHYDTFR